jgi:hypothetical protein
MADYNDGKWHGWNGGEWPEGVHRASLVEAYYSADTYDDDFAALEALKSRAAITRHWPEIVAFCVTKPYREPRVIWVNEHEDGIFCAYGSEEEARENASDPIRTAVRYVEAPE